MILVEQMNSMWIISQIYLKKNLSIMKELEFGKFKIGMNPVIFI